MQDNYPNLPGVLVDMQDGGLKIKTSTAAPTTDSVILLGTAVDGPLMNPVPADLSNVEATFGSGTRANGLPNGSTLVKGLEQAYAGGSRDIRLMRVTGSNATGAINATAITATNDVSKDDILGVAPGNAQITFPLANGGIIPSTVTVNANGVTLSSSAFTVNAGTAAATPATTPIPGSVTLNANATDSNASVYVSYQYVDISGNVITTSQNSYTDGGGVLHQFVATGAPVTFQLSAVVKPGTIHLYANGVTVDAGAYSVDNTGKGVSLNPGFVPLNAQLEATYLNTVSVTEQPTIDIDSIFAGFLYNGVSYAVKDVVNQLSQVVGKQVVFYKPDSKKAQVSEAPLTYSSLNFPSFGLLVQAVNGDPNNNVVRLTVDNLYVSASTSTLLSVPQTYLSGGDDGIGLSNQQMYEALGGKRDSNGNLISQGAYQLLENYSVDHVVPLGVLADSPLAGKYDNFAYQLAVACAVMTFRNHTTVGHIATSSPSDTTLLTVANQVAALAAAPNAFFFRDASGNILKDSAGNNMDLGRYINIIAGPDAIFNSTRFGVYAENSAAAYAGFVSNLQPQSAPTNKSVSYAVGLRFEYSNGQLNTLAGARYVTLRAKNNGSNVAITDAMTAAQPGSDYVRLSTIRVVKAVIDQVRDAADPFIGEPNETAQRNALSAAISKRLDVLKKNGVIIGSDFQIVASPQDQLLGQASVELSITPPQELRKLTVVVSLTPGA
jgi:hypothetical protein